MPGVTDLPKFKYKDLEEILAGGQGLVPQVVTYIRVRHCFYRLFHTGFFSSHDDKV